MKYPQKSHSYPCLTLNSCILLVFGYNIVKHGLIILDDLYFVDNKPKRFIWAIKCGVFRFLYILLVMTLPKENLNAYQALNRAYRVPSGCTPVYR